MIINNVSLLTGNLQPKGHPFFVDKKTVEGAAALLAGKPLASHHTHADAGKDRLGSAIGFFKDIYADGIQLRARSFEFLDSFKTNSKALYDNLAELAAKFPETFGVSLNMKYAPVWVMKDGSEVPAKIMDGKLAESAPKDAVRSLPSARVTAVASGDFVSSPAANLTGLLSGLLAEIDTNHNNTMSKTEPVTFDQAALDAKLAEQKQAVTAELSTAHKTEVDTINAKLAEVEKAKAELDAALTAANKQSEEATAAVSALLTAVGVKAEKYDGPSIKAALDEKISSEAQAFLAARGMKPLPEKLAQAGEIETNLNSDEKILEAYLSLKHGSDESIKFVEKYRDAIWRAQSGRR